MEKGRNMSHLNQSDLSESELLNRNLGSTFKAKVRRYLNTVKQAGLAPQHALEISGLHLSTVNCWEEAYRIITSQHLALAQASAAPQPMEVVYDG